MREGGQPRWGQSFRGSLGTKQRQVGLKDMTLEGKPLPAAVLFSESTLGYYDPPILVIFLFSFILLQ